MNIKNLVLAFFITVSILFAGLYLSVKSQAPAPSVQAGAVSGPDNYTTISFQAGMRGAFAPFVSTTTVACSVQNPTNATSTWTASYETIVSTTTTTVLALSTSTTANRYATSTAIQSSTVAANAMGNFSFVPASNQGIVGPKDWVIVGYGAGTTLANVAQNQQGVCQVLFNKI